MATAFWSSKCQDLVIFLLFFSTVALSQNHFWLRRESVVLYPRHRRRFKVSVVSPRCWLLALFAAPSSPVSVAHHLNVNHYLICDGGGSLLSGARCPRDVAPTLSVSFPVFRAINRLLIPTSNDVPALRFTSVSVSTSSGFLLLGLMNLLVD